MSEEQKPSIGRIVHVITENQDEDGKNIHLPAIIIKIHTASGANGDLLYTFDLELQIFGGRNAIYIDRFRFDPSATKPGTWHWPERE